MVSVGCEDDEHTVEFTLRLFVYSLLLLLPSSQFPFLALSGMKKTVKECR
jgi:hypothetical protein